MSWVMQCEQCKTISDGYWLRQPWVAAKKDSGTVTLKIYESRERPFRLPAVPSGVSLGDLDATSALHFCSLDCLQKYIAAALTPKEEEVTAA